MRIFVEGFGKSITRRDNQIVFKENGEEIDYYPVHKLSQIVITGKGYITFDALRILAEHEVECVSIDWKGQLDYRLTPPEMKNASIKKEQYYSLLDKRSGVLAKAFIKAKIENQKATLTTLSKSREDQGIITQRDKVAEFLLKLEDLNDSPVDKIRSKIFGIEGSASVEYWKGFSYVIDESLGFTNRSGRGARDPVNAMLNYGYALLQSEIWRTMHLAGLDPYCGFLHSDKKGRISLVFDLMEEFRQQIVDKSVLALFNRNQVDQNGFKMEENYLKIDDKTRRLLISTIQKKLLNHIDYNGKNLKYRDIMLNQARLIGKFLLNEEKYSGFSLRW
jgi:CRISPR-associated protein Cas1